jgi:hypothetical protein
MVQNNRYNTASHCIQAKSDNGTKAGFNLTQVSANVMEGGAPASYPSVVYGWHVNGRFYGGLSTGRQISTINTIPSALSATVPGAGRYNLSYDTWIGPNATAANEQGTLEHMIWLVRRETVPIGSQVASVELAGTTWEVWYGPNGGGWNTVSYVRVTNTTSSDIDLKPFFDDSVTRGYTSASSYILGIQAGFEIWEANQNFSVDSYSVSIN